jgi:translocation and assembly module TamA
MNNLIRYVLATAFIVMPSVTTLAFSESNHRQEVRKIAVPGNDHEKAVSLLLDSYHKSGFLKATVDSTKSTGEELTVYITKGNEYFYQSREVIFEPGPPSSPGDLFTGGVLSFAEFDAATREVFRFYSNNGYPFARIQQERVEIKDDRVNLSLRIIPGDVVYFDSIRMIGNIRFTESFLFNLVGIKKGVLFNEKLVEEAAGKFDDLDYMMLSGPLMMEFSPGKASLVVAAQRTRPSRFDGIAGLSGGGENNVPLQVSGDLNLYLSNVLRAGEFIDLSWQGPGNSTQVLHVNAGYPFPLGIALEPELMFALHKQDTSWLQLQIKPSLFFKINAAGKIGVFLHHTNNNLIASNEITSHSPSSYADFIINRYGIEYRFITGAYHRQLISNGLLATLNAAAGSAKIKDVSQQTLPTQVTEKRIFSLSGKSEARYKTGRISTLVFSANMAWQSGNNLPQNQLYRIGGFKTLKGFDELSIAASSYAITSLEWRYFTGALSYFNFFTNAGWYEQKVTTAYYSNWPAAIGTGMNMETRAGIFSINLAVGWQKGAAFAFKNSKVHLGYISTF